MNKTEIITWGILIVLTIASALLSGIQSKFTILLIIVISALKFIGVAFQFMELKNAHVFWKAILLSFLIVYTMLILIII